MPKKLTEIIEASLTDLQIEARDFNLDPVCRFYAEVLLHFMNSNLEALNDKLTELKENELLKAELHLFWSDLKIITELRYDLRIKKLNLKKIYSILQIQLSDPFEAEKYFLLGRAFEELKNEKENIKCSLKAAALYKQIGCFKKSVRAFYNAIVAETRLTPYKSYISEYQSIIQQSIQINDMVFAGMTQVMLAREYQIIGQLQKAFELCVEGLFNLEPEKGSLHYFHALLQKADLLIQFKKTQEAEILLTETRLAHFAEIKAARQLLECFLDRKKIWNKELEPALLPTWKERLSLLSQQDQKEQNSFQLTALELKLVKLLWNGPQNKWDMIAQIYDDTSNSEILENRFKNLIARTKKKLPNTISFVDGRYFIDNKTDLQI